MHTLGASQFAAAAGLHPNNSRAKLWRVMTGREQVEHFRPDWLANGVRDEHWAVEEAQKLAGFVWLDTGDSQRSHFKGRLRATPDGICPPYGLEVKCPQFKMYKDIPAYYMPQLQGQCYVCDLEEVMFLAWIGGHIKAWWVPRSEEYIAAMLPLLDEFLTYLDVDLEPTRVGRRPTMPEVSSQLQLWKGAA